MRTSRRAPAGTDLNELLRPSMQAVEPASHDELPWRLRSQLYVGFFGGALAVTAVAWENARRLGAPTATRWWILAAGAAGVVAATAVGSVPSSRLSATGALLAYRVIGVCVAIVVGRLQRSPDRIYQYRRSGWSEEDLYDSMLAVGIGACAAGILLQSALVMLLGGTA